MGSNKNHAAWDEMIQGYLEGSQSAAEEQATRELLSQDAFCRRLAEYALDTAYLYELGREGFLFPETDSLKAVKTKSGQHTLRWWIRLAACVLIVVSLLSWLGYRIFQPELGISICKIEQLSGTVYKRNQNHEIQLESTHSIAVGDQLRVEGPGSYLQLVFDDGTQIVLTDHAIVYIQAMTLQKKILLTQGHLSADVFPQASNAPLVISTPHADAEVLGTRLSIHAEGDRTTLGVFTGRVRMRRHSDGSAIQVEQGQQAVASRHSELVAIPISRTPDSWSEDFETGLPGQWRCGQWVTEGLPPGSAGGVLAEARFFGKPRADNYHCVTTYKDWTRGLFRIHEDSVLHFTYKLERPGWFHIMMGVRSDREHQFHVGNYETKDDSLWNIPASQWRTEHVPLSTFVKSPNSGLKQLTGTHPRVGDVVYMLFFNSHTQDIGLVVDRIWITREPPSSVTPQK